MQAVECQVESLTSLTEHVYKVLLKPAQTVHFLPGQYLNFVMSEDDKRPFSIASAPDSEFIELQLGAFGEDSYAMQVIDRVKTGEPVTIEMPLGQANLRTESERPVLLVAGGTGFSYIKSMFEYLVQQNTTREVIIYWGLRDESACYELEKTTQALSTIENGKFFPVIESPSEAWQGKEGLVHQAVLNDFNDLSAYDIYVAGRFDMVGIVRDDFITQGALIEHMFADAFAFI